MESEHLGRQIDGLFSDCNERQMRAADKASLIQSRLDEHGFKERPIYVLHLGLNRKLCFVHEGEIATAYDFDDLEDLLSGNIKLDDSEWTALVDWYEASIFNDFSREHEIKDLMSQMDVDDVDMLVSLQREAQLIEGSYDRSRYFDAELAYRFGETDPDRLKILRSIFNMY
ncbi:hypothetical protein HGB25_00720 [Candidatus Saccharibacteria bacterium]|nr:hypothetical protein [Candidatus Saccharibacteria bacterium]